MKNPLVVAVAMLALGIAIGWIAKPDAAKTVAEVAAKKTSSVTATSSPSAPEVAAVPGKRSIRPTKREPEKPHAATANQVQQMQEQMTKNMVDRQRQKFEQNIDKLTESLDLTETQKGTLTQWLEERLQGLESINMSDPKSMVGVTSVIEKLTPEELAKQLDGSLTAEQQTALADFKDREHRNEVDSRALKSLSKLQSIIQFEDGQRDEVYKLLTESAEESLSNESKHSDIGSMLTENMGIETDPYDLGIQQAMTQALTDSSKAMDSPANQADSVKQLRELIATRIETKVEKLRPVLNDRQLDAYRNELKTKGLGVYGTVLDSMEAASGTPPEK